ncbi:MAG: DnaJ C-terminal domain-containing protein [Acidobacteriota bacterium]
MAVKYKDYYEALGVQRTASQDEIRKAYRRLARKYHPDVNPGNKEAEDRFKEIQEANAVLSDPERRRQYDRLGQNWRSGADFTPPPGWEGAHVEFGDLGDLRDIFGGGSGGMGGFSDFFESLFGGTRKTARAGRGPSRPGQDSEAEISLTLEEAHRGTRRVLTLSSSSRTNRIDVNIPAGVRGGSIVRVPGKGEPGRGGGASGDLLLRVKILPHPQFQIVDNDDVLIELPVAPWETALGTKVKVPTLDGSVELNIPAGSQGGQRFRLKERGLKRRRDGRGDQYVKLKIVNPPSLSDQEKELFTKLRAHSKFNPRETLSGDGI